MNNCKSCGRSIEWGVTNKGSKMPLDVGEYPDGNLVIVAGIIRMFDSTAHEGQPRRRSHYASCPQAPQWRQR